MRVTTVSARYSGEKRLYTFMVTKEFAQTLKEKDIVLVKAANGLGVVRVVKIHETSQATGNYKYRWAFQKVDMDSIKHLEQEEKAGNVSHIWANGGESGDFDDDIPF